MLTRGIGIRRERKEYKVEEWKSIPGWESYEASTFGRIRFKGRKNTFLKNAMSKRSSSNGRMHVDLCRFGKKKRFSVARLILMAFIGPPPFERAMARHLNDIPSDNKLSNLAWGTKKQNTEDAKRNNRYKSPSWKGKELSEEHRKKIGDGNRGKRLTEDQKKRISKSMLAIWKIRKGLVV